jgi:hypothetical protein
VAWVISTWAQPARHGGRRARRCEAEGLRPLPRLDDGAVLLRGDVGVIDVTVVDPAVVVLDPLLEVSQNRGV